MTAQVFISFTSKSMRKQVCGPTYLLSEKVKIHRSFFPLFLLTVRIRFLCGRVICLVESVLLHARQDDQVEALGGNFLHIQSVTL